MQNDAASRTLPMYDGELYQIQEPRKPSVRALRRRFNKAARLYCAGAVEYTAVMAAYNAMLEAGG